ncbi:hypothetical protein RRG08_058774 [Elysia crispata]|uniref:Uncharacterized protein n=1 Tax=Elysia crispata TaxID=231223 RepID=A0AAE1D5V4_9GAST|nr:hypothetical protein RRG08_058774 [Elysia crispata]
MRSALKVPVGPATVFSKNEERPKGSCGPCQFPPRIKSALNVPVGPATVSSKNEERLKGSCGLCHSFQQE